MKLKYIILYVENVEKSAAFYQQAFGYPLKLVSEFGGYIELDTGETVLAFLSRESVTEMGKHAAVPDPKQPGFEIALETDDVPAALEKAVSSGATLVQKPTEMPWGQTISYVSDIDGFMVEICTPVGG